MIQIVGIGGEPATGKTSLMKYVMSSFGEGQPYRFAKLHGIQFDEVKTFVLGIYDDEPFSGTDRLSMAVIVDAKEFLSSICQDPKWFGWTVLFEGDRLFNRTFIEFCTQKTEQAHFLVLETTAEEKKRRHELRGDTQDESWLRGRSTKIKNILESIPSVKRVDNSTELKQPDIAGRILQLMENFVKRAGAN